jgi:hypothetical protein
VPEHRDPLVVLAEQLRDPARRLALAGAGAHGADRHDRAFDDVSIVCARREQR